MIAKHPAYQFLIAIATMTVAILIRLSLNPLLGSVYSYSMILPATAFLIMQCGLWPSIAALFFGTATTAILFHGVPPNGGLLYNVLGSIIYTCSGC
jgi:hypothetical protein